MEERAAIMGFGASIIIVGLICAMIVGIARARTETAKEAIQAGLVQGKFGRWITPELSKEQECTH